MHFANLANKMHACALAALLIQKTEIQKLNPNQK